MLPARVDCVGAKRIRFSEDPTACGASQNCKGFPTHREGVRMNRKGADRNRKGLAEQRKRLQRTRNPEGEERIRSPVLQALFPVKLHPKGSDRVCSPERQDDLRVNWNRYPVRWIQ